MIHGQGKRYQLVFWESETRDGHEAALKLEFDDLEEAKAAFEANKADSAYRSGILIAWHKAARDWDLIERYPG
jgi:hypothetical protein